MGRAVPLQVPPVGEHAEERLAGIDDLDELLSRPQVLAGTPPGAVDDLRVRFAQEAFRHHIASNVAFGRYCERLGADVDAWRSVDDVAAAPVLPSLLFKRPGLSVRTGEDDVVWTTSSGTQGSISRVPRDDTTLTRFFASVTNAARELLHMETFGIRIFNLGPRPEEAEHLWISYAVAGLQVLAETEFYVTDGELDVDRFLEDVARHSPSDGLRPVVVGPPALVLDVAAAVESSDVPTNFGDDALVIAIGGWKRRATESIDRSTFTTRAVRAFGLADDSQVRDAFNMVELNTAVMECAAKRKHCPPWLLVRPRDARTLAPKGDGESGVLAYIDPTPTSYPGFVLSDDFGRVHHNVGCECGVQGDVVVVERRVNRVEQRGCALKLSTGALDR